MESIEDSYLKNLLMNTFESNDPCVSYLPNCLFENNEISFKKFFNVVGVPIGIWGNFLPAYTKENKPYSGSENNFLIEDFVLWKSPLNQKEALERGYLYNFDMFTMCINADISPGILASLFDYVKPLKYERVLDNGHKVTMVEEIFVLSKCMKMVCKFITDIKWAYIQLGGEIGLAMFVTSEEELSLLNRFEKELKTIKAPIYKLTHQDNTTKLKKEPA